MSPVTIYMLQILLHYFTSSTDYPDMTDPSQHGAWRRTIDELCRLQLLQSNTRQVEPNVRIGAYQITERGEAYIRGLRQVPLPVSTWRIDWSTVQEAR